jgi:putative endonuclease
MLTRQKGDAGETAAMTFLKKKGWRVLATNWRYKQWELDIVCEEGDTVVFVEVKTRAATGMTNPMDALSPEKRRCLIRAAQAWLSKHNAWSRPCRFDLVSVVEKNGHYQTELIRNVIELGQDAGHSAGRGNAAWQPW